MIRPLVAQKRIDDVDQEVAAVTRKRQEEGDENQRSLLAFHSNLALLSGGTVALSVTYLGYLNTLPTPPAHLIFLVLSWVTLFISLVCATYYALVITYYNHHARQREYLQRLKERHAILAEEVPYLNIVNIKTSTELDAFIKEQREAVAVREREIKIVGRKEKLYTFLWVWCSRISRITFIVGIFLLLSFAAENISTKPKILETKQPTTAAATAQKETETGAKDRVVEIPCVGIVTFPGSMSVDDVNAACRLLYLRKQETIKKDGLVPCKAF